MYGYIYHKNQLEFSLQEWGVSDLAAPPRLHCPKAPPTEATARCPGLLHAPRAIEIRGQGDS